MSQYLPLCDYFAQKTRVRSRLAWASINTFGVFALNVLGHRAALGDLKEVGIASFALGICWATVSCKIVVPDTLRKQQVGLKRGGEIMRATQLAAVFVPLALSLSIHSANANDTQNYKHEPIENAIEVVIAEP